jgi:hypothetical protein
VSTYSDAPFTLDASAPIDANAPPSVSYTDQDAVDLKSYADGFYAVASGPLTFTVSMVAELTVTASVSGDQGDVLIDWGDGQVTPYVDATTEHVYGAYGDYLAAAYATIDGVDYVAGYDVDVDAVAGPVIAGP